MTSIAQLKQPTPRFKQTILRGAGNRTLVNIATFSAVDATNLAFLYLDLAVGDVVECTLMCNAFNSVTTNYGGIDFEVDRPVSANTRVNQDNDFGATMVAYNTRIPSRIVARFTCTEAGSHGFRPVWRCYNTATTMTMSNTASGDDDVPIVFTVENKGPTL